MVGIIATATGATSLGILAFSALLAEAYRLIYLSGKGAPLDHIFLEKETFFNILAVSTALTGQGAEPFGKAPINTNTATAIAGLFAYSALSQ